MTKRGVGRPAQYKNMRHFHARIPAHMRDYLYELGMGNASKGVRRLIKDHWDDQYEMGLRGISEDLQSPDAFEWTFWMAAKRIHQTPELCPYLDVLLPEDGPPQGNDRNIDRLSKYTWLGFAPIPAIIDWLIVENGGEMPKGKATSVPYPVSESGTQNTA